MNACTFNFGKFLNEKLQCKITSTTNGPRASIGNVNFGRWDWKKFSLLFNTMTIGSIMTAGKKKDKYLDWQNVTKILCFSSYLIMGLGKDSLHITIFKALHKSRILGGSTVIVVGVVHHGLWFATYCRAFGPVGRAGGL